MNWQGAYVEVLKSDVAENPLVPTADKENFEYGQINEGKSIPKGYVCTGYLIYDPQEIGFVYLDRDTRNGEVYPGVLRTTKIINVVEIDEVTLKVETLNSIYTITKIAKIDGRSN